MNFSGIFLILEKLLISPIMMVLFLFWVIMIIRFVANRSMFRMCCDVVLILLCMAFAFGMGKRLSFSSSMSLKVVCVFISVNMFDEIGK